MSTRIKTRKGGHARACAGAEIRKGDRQGVSDRMRVCVCGCVSFWHRCAGAGGVRSRARGLVGVGDRFRVSRTVRLYALHDGLLAVSVFFRRDFEVGRQQG